MDNLEFEAITEDTASWLQREFGVQEVKEAVFSANGDKAPGLDGFSMAFFQQFLDLLKEDVMAFMCEFYSQGKLPKTIGASFISLIP